MNQSQLIIFRRIELHLGKQAVDSFRSFEEALVTEDQEYDVIALPEQRRWQPGTARLASSKDSRSQTCLISSPPRLIASLSSSPSLPLWLLAPLPSPPLWPWLPAPLATPGPPADGIETPRRAL